MTKEMSTKETREAVGVEAVERLELAVKRASHGPNHSAIGHVVEDCALVHMDYLAGVDETVGEIIQTIAELTGESQPEVYARLRPPHECDCSSCAGPEQSAKNEADYLVHLLAELTPEFRAALHAAFLADFSKQLLSEEAVEAAARFVHDRHINEVGMVDFPWDERRLDGPWGETARSGREFAKERVRPVIQTALKAANRGPSHAE